MPRLTLVTGGAGFIGAQVARELVDAGDRVRVLDRLVGHVHPDRRRPAHLPEEVELQPGDLRDADAVRRALRGVDRVVHLAALVGVGQSMYDLAEYTSANQLGTAVLLEAMMDQPIERLVVASCTSVYGEGAYVDAEGNDVPDAKRARSHLRTGRFDVVDVDGTPLTPVPTPETKSPSPASVYALSKYGQEQLCLLVGTAYRVEVVALRVAGAYGPFQPLANPHAGVLASFATRLLNGRPPRVFEDGEQLRDFVHVRDVARAFALALESPKAPGRVLNVGSGRGVRLLDVARRLAQVLGRPLEPEPTGRYRAGDVRHSIADVAAAERLLGFRASVPLERGLEELGVWLSTQLPVDGSDAAMAQLVARGLTS